MNFFFIFFTGLTTGGLTCLAVQGGLLASSMTRPVEAPQVKRPKKPLHRRKALRLPTMEVSPKVWPVVYFLAAKLAVYTLLGALLGVLGSVLQITPTAQAIMQIVIGLFMVATALNMLNVHPIFRYVVIQPPPALTRFIRNQAKSQEIFAPVLLRLLTVFIPCGTTQVIQSLAISTANPLLGALIMFVFVLGTAPTFLALGFFATRLRGQFQKSFSLIAALLILFLGVLSLDGGLKLVGSPLAPSQVLSSLIQPGDPVLSTRVEGMEEFTITVANTRYSPNYLSAPSGQPIRVRLVTNNTYGCTRAFTIPALRIRQILPASGETVIELPPQPPGKLYFTCSMGMYSGRIIVK